MLPGILQVFSSCGRGGATLQTDNVQAEWFPKGSSTTIILEHESKEIQEDHLPAQQKNIALLYTSLGENQGTLSANGGRPETAAVVYEQAEKKGPLRFKTLSREILIQNVHAPFGDGNTASFSGWSYQERGSSRLRNGEGGSLITNNPAPF